MEILREVTINVEVDTNKATYTERFDLDEFDTVAEMLAALTEWLEQRTP
jgi:hypothetical protein